jgi:acetylornithine deacetylase
MNAHPSASAAAGRSSNGPARPSDASIEMIRQLIGFPTTSRDSNLELIHFVRDYLKSNGVDDVRLTFDDDRRKANLFATFGPRAPGGRGGLVLSGHTDVVPVQGQPWDTDPFTMVERDGRLFGRGASDMKGFVGVVLSKLPQFMARELRTPVHFAFSYDEEIGCIGVRRLIADLADAGV